MTQVKNPKVFISNFPFGRLAKEPLDILAANGLDVSVNPLQRKLTPQEVAEYAKDADGIIAGTENLDLLIQGAKNLKIISRVGIGLDSVPLSLCRQKEITVTYTPDAVSMAVVELTIGLMVSLTRQVVFADREIRRGNWTRPFGKRLQESVIGIIGFGRVGSKVARYLSAFQPKKILVHDIKDKTDEVKALESTGLNIVTSNLESIYAESDIISLHVPYSNSTKYMIDQGVFAKMKPEAFIINTARGGIIREEHLYEALKNGKISGAALDVFEKEPYQGPLAELDNIILTQHIGSCSYDCRLNMESQAATDLVNFFNGLPLKNPVPEEEYQYQQM